MFLFIIALVFLDQLQGLFKVKHFSATGTSEREREEKTYMLFIDLLHECEGESTIAIVQPCTTIHTVLQLHAYTSYLYR